MIRGKEKEREGGEGLRSLEITSFEVVLDRGNLESGSRGPFNFIRVAKFFFFCSFLDAITHLYKRVCPSVHQRPSVGHTRVELMKNNIFMFHGSVII